jgi:type II secretory pathway component PulM
MIAMITNLSTRERRIVLGAIATALVIGGWIFVVEPIRAHNASTAELLPVRADLLARRRQLVSRKEAIAAELKAADQRIESLSTRFLVAAAPAVAASELQNIAKAMTAAAKTETRTERILPPVERGELLEIPIELAISGEIGQIVDLLDRIERAPKLLRVNELKVRVMNVSQPKELLATMTLSGFIRTAKAKA